MIELGNQRENLKKIKKNPLKTCVSRKKSVTLQQNLCSEKIVTKISLWLKCIK